MPRSRCFVLALLLAIHAILLACGATLQSPTFNEPGHLVSGLHILDSGKVSTYRVNPPLVRTVAAIPAAISGYRADWSGYFEGTGARPEFEMGEDLITANGRRSLWLLTMARWACIPFSLLGAWTCFLWARDLFGSTAGVMACTLWCISPMVLGQAMTIAPDVHATSLGLIACYTFWRWLRKPTWYQAIVTGALLGLAELAKTTLILFYPLWPLIWVLYRLPESRRMNLGRWIREAGMLALRMLVGIYVLNMGYLGEGSFQKLEDYRFVSKLFGGPAANIVVGGNRFEGSSLGELYVPFPSNYVVGIDIQQRDFESFNRPSYLRGRYQEKGWWYYYAYAILIKAPIGSLGLLALSVLLPWTATRGGIGWTNAMVLLLPPAVIFCVVSMKSGFSHHSRYILPCVPFAFIWMSRLAVYVQTLSLTIVAICRRPGLRSDVTATRFRSSAIGVIVVSLLGWSIASSICVYPHSLSYFNAFAGGPKNGPQHLLNSNIDWGQDLLFLENWIQRHSPDPKAPVYLAFYNYYNPFDLEIERIEPWPWERDQVVDPTQVPDGVYAISVNLLYEFPWQVRDRDGRRYHIDTRPLAYLRRVEPIGRAGYSIRVYSARQVREAYASPATARLWHEDR